MKNSKSDDGEILRRLCDALAESVADLPNAEVLAEARDAGEDPSTIAGELREAAFATLKSLGALPSSRPGYRHVSRGWRRTWGWRVATLAAAVSLFIGGFFAGARRPGAILSGAKDQIYLLLLWKDSDFRPPPVSMEARVHEYAAWGQELRRQGHLVLEERLATSGWLLKVGRPLAELPAVKEGAQISGLFMIRSSSEAEALAISRGCPHLRYGGSIELRRIPSWR